MSDGVELVGDLYLPAAGAGPLPAIVERTPYSRRNEKSVQMAEHLAAAGYAVFCQDVRGRYGSDGRWVPFRNEGRDGYETIEWVARQPWCDGRVGTMGGSYCGWVQWAAAVERPPALRTMLTSVPIGGWLTEAPFRNGMISLPALVYLHQMADRVEHEVDPEEIRAAFSHRPVREMDSQLGRDIPLWREWLDHPCPDDYWRAQLISDEQLKAIDVPALVITGWYDVHQRSSLRYFDIVSRLAPGSDRQFLLVGPWDHDGCRRPEQRLGDIDFSAGAVVDMLALYRAWFDRWLLSDATAPFQPEGRVRLFLTGANRWIAGDAWPKPAGDEPSLLYLREEGRLSSVAPGDEEPDRYLFDPRDPVTGPIGDSEADAVLLDRGGIERRPDVLTFTSEPAVNEVTIVGRPRLVLYAGSEGPDTDWVVSLVDVHPDGRSIFLADAGMRARFRESPETESWMEPAGIYRFELELTAIAHVLKPGHELRLRITSSDFPSYDVNGNTRGPIGAQIDLKPVWNRVYHQRASESHLLLPVVGGTITAGQLPRW
jgi:uncharacterized protein